MKYYPWEAEKDRNFHYRIVMNGHGQFTLERFRRGLFGEKNVTKLGWEDYPEWVGDGNGEIPRRSKHPVLSEKVDLRKADWGNFYGTMLFSEVTAAAEMLHAVKRDYEDTVQNYRRSRSWSVIAEE